jgi:hypothetical protein
MRHWATTRAAAWAGAPDWAIVSMHAQAHQTRRMIITSLLPHKYMCPTRVYIKDVSRMPNVWITSLYLARMWYYVQCPPVESGTMCRLHENTEQHSSSFALRAQGYIFINRTSNGVCNHTAQTAVTYHCPTVPFMFVGKIRNYNNEIG